MARKDITQLLSKAPGISVTEHDLSNYDLVGNLPSPVCLVFGFAQRGAVLEPKYMTGIAQINDEYGEPTTSVEKYFYNAGVRVLQGGGTPLMVRLPYDNVQTNTVKFVRYSVEPPIHLDYVHATDESEGMYREVDNDGVDALEKLNELDDHLKGFSRIKCASESIESMTTQKFDDVMMDSSELEDDSIYIFDIKKQQLGTNPLLDEHGFQHLGIVPVLVTASTALYVQEKLKNDAENDKLFNLISIPMKYKEDGTVDKIDPSGLVLDGDWTNMKEESDEETVQNTLKQVLTEFSQTLDFNHTGTYYDKRSVGDTAALQFPLIRYNSPKHLESRCFDQLGIVVFEMVFNNDTDNVDFVMRESFCGYISNTDFEHPPLENLVNTQSKYIRIIRKVRGSYYRDFFHISNQPLVVMGMTDLEMLKKVNYMRSIEEPITYSLDTWFGDVDGTHIDLVLDAGITTVAHHSWKRYLEDPDGTFFFNPTLEKVFDAVTPTMEELEYCSTAWHRMVKMFTGFIETKRGDCLFIADGPRCLNVDRNVPLLQRSTTLRTTDILNRYLKYFTGKSTSYGMRIFNWVMATDHYSQLAIWMPPSIIAAQLYCTSENYTHPWYAVAGPRRGRAERSSFISLKTKPYSDDNNILYAANWNYFVQGIDTGVMLEGNKTMQLDHTALDRVNVRRLCNYIKRKMRDISNSVKYEGNTAALRGAFSVSVSDMLTFIQRNAGLEDFMVICDDRNNTRESIERNELRCTIVIKPVKAIEYISIDLCLTKSSIDLVEKIPQSYIA